MNTLPLDSDDMPVVALDGDTAELFQVFKATQGTIGASSALVLGIEISD